MRLSGLSVSAQLDQRHALAPMQSAARDFWMVNSLRAESFFLFFDLCDSLPKGQKQGKKSFTRDYRGLRALILDRTGREWHPGNLNRAKTQLVEYGVIKVSPEGDVEINYGIFDQKGTYTDRKNADRLRRSAEEAQAAESAKHLELPESDLTVIDMKPQEAPAAEPVMDEATNRAQTFNQRQVAKQTYAEEKQLREYNERKRQEDCEEEEEESPIDKLIRERQEKQEEEAAKERSITAGISFVERTEYKRKQKIREPQATIQPSERELEFARRRKVQEAEDAEMQRFADWLDYRDDPRIIWYERNRHGYQDFLESLKPKPKPEPVPVSASSDADDGGNW